jgi:hypothetical protein
MITPKEAKNICLKLGLKEVPYEEYNFYEYSSPIFNADEGNNAIVILEKKPTQLTKDRIYFYDKLIKGKFLGWTLTCQQKYNAYVDKEGIRYNTKFNKKTFEAEIKKIILEIKKTALNEKLNDIEKDFK